MNASELATKMLEWETKAKQLQVLEDEIKVEVLKLGSSQKVGNVSATYRKATTTYLYEDAVKNSGVKYDPTEYQKVEINYRQIALDYELEVEGVTKGEPSVSLKFK